MPKQREGIPAGYWSLMDAQERAEKEGWKNWETAYLLACIEELPNMEHNVYEALKPLAKNGAAVADTRQAASELKRWVLSENYAVVDWEAIATHYLHKIIGGWTPVSKKD